jgi:hypothetical protein
MILLRYLCSDPHERGHSRTAVEYPDLDLLVIRDEAGGRYTHKDGSHIQSDSRPPPGAPLGAPDWRKSLIRSSTAERSRAIKRRSCYALAEGHAYVAGLERCDRLQRLND